jgi:uncharacterized protein (DUF433 family)
MGQPCLASLVQKTQQHEEDIKKRQQEDALMQDQQLLEHITCNPKVMAGNPVIKGTRLTVEYILNLRAHGATEEELLAEYHGLTQEDIQACYLFAGKSLETTEVYVC